MTSFLFYDTETTGLSSSFDQILTFAAIRTDLSLNEIERYELNILMRPDIVPSPGAFITHRLLPENLSEGVCEYEGAKKIHTIVNTPGTISIGYNNLGFDDEFLRFTFYRNLLDPYSHQYANNCCRMDLLPIATLYRIFKPEIINWPKTDDGKSTLKLELMIPSLKQKMAEEQGEGSFNISGIAHNAMVDVEITVALAKFLIKEDKMWQYCLSFFDKKSDRARIESFNHSFMPSSNLYQSAPPFKPSEDTSCSHFYGQREKNYILAIMVSHKLGADSMYMAPVLGIGRSSHYANQSLWLRLDRELIHPSGVLNPEDLFIIRKKDGENNIILPPLKRFWNRLSDEQKFFVEKNRVAINGNCDNQSLLEKTFEYHREFKYPFVPEADLDTVLYQSSFFTRAEKQEMNQFHKNSLSEKIAMVERMNSSRIRSMAVRILFRNYLDQEGIAPFIVKAYEEYMDRVRSSSKHPDIGREKIIGFRNDERLVPEAALDEIEQIYNNGTKIDDEQKKILKWLEKFIPSI